LGWLASDYFGPPVTPLAGYAASVAPGYAVPGLMCAIHGAPPPGAFHASKSAPGRFVGAARLPPQAPADWLCGFGRVQSPPFPPVLRHCALRPKQRGPRACGSAAGCAVPGFTTARLAPQAPTDWLCAPCWLGYPSLPLARGHWLARRLPSLPRPRTALVFHAPNCRGSGKGSVLPTQPESVVGN